MGSLASINIRFKADLSGFSTEVQNASRQIEQVGKTMQKVGTAMSLAITAPVGILATKATQLYDTQAKAVAQVEAGLRSTGNAVGYTSKQLQDMASGLQENSLFGDEEILKGVTAQLLTFTNIANKEFERTQLAALDLATRLDGDLKSASIQLGKALNDPKANLSALSRSGIQFSESQKTVINALQESGRLAEAQTIILDELEKQYGGSAKAASEAGTGGIKQLSNSWGDLLEMFGEIIANGLKPLVSWLKGLVQSMQEMSPETKKVVVVVAALAAAIGPLTLVIGTVLTLIPTMIAGFAAVKGAILAVTTVIAANPFGAMAIALGAIVSTVVIASSRFSDLTNASKEYEAVTAKASQAIAKEKTELEKNLAVAKDEKASKESRKKAIENLNKLSPEYLGNITLENVYTKETTASVNKYNEALLTKAKIMAAQEKLVEVQKKLLDLQLGQSDAVKPSLWQNMKNAMLSYGSSTAFASATAKTMAENLGTEYSELDKLKNLLVAFLGENNALVTSNEEVATSINAVVSSAEKLPKAGTIAFYEAEIAKLQKIQKEATLTQFAYLGLQKRIDEFQDKINDITAPIVAVDIPEMSMPKLNADEFQESLFKSSDYYKSMVDRIAAEGERLKATQDATNLAMKTKAEELNEAYGMIGDAFGGLFESYATGFVDSLDIANEGMKSFVQGLVATITKLIAMALSASMAQAIQGSQQSATATGPGVLCLQLQLLWQLQLLVF